MSKISTIMDKSILSLVMDTISISFQKRCKDSKNK